MDVLIKRNTLDEIETSVYRKVTNTDIYMNWYSHAPSTWKIATLKSLVKRAFLLSSNTESLNSELEHIKNTFSDKNDYPLKLVEEIIKNERNYQQQKLQQSEISDDAHEEIANSEIEEPATLTLNLPYAGDKGEKLISKVKKYVCNTVNKNKKKVSVNAIYRVVQKKLPTHILCSFGRSINFYNLPLGNDIWYIIGYVTAKFHDLLPMSSNTIKF